MAYSNGFISGFPSITDIQQALSCGWNSINGLITYGAINKWAKYKPVIAATVQILTDAQRILANYGIKDIPTWTRLSYMSTFLFSSSRGSLSSNYWPECDISKGSLSLEYFEYDIPVGTANSPFRIGDFQNYLHHAAEPIGPIVSNEIKIQPIGTLRVQFVKGAESAYTLALSDLTWPGSTSFPIGNMYFGVLMKQISGTITSRTYVATQKNGDGNINMTQALQQGYWVDFSSAIVEQAFEGTWRIYPIISSIPIAETTSISTQDGNKFIAPLPFHNQDITMHILWAEIQITSAFGYKDATSQQRYAKVNLSLSNTDSVARNFTAVVTLCDAEGVQLTGYSGGTVTGQISGGSSAVFTAQLYIAQIWSADMYFKVQLTITDVVKFKRTSYWGMTGPIQGWTPTPE